MWLIYLGEAEGEGEEGWRMGLFDLVNTNPLGFHRTKASCAIRSLSGTG